MPSRALFPGECIALDVSSGAVVVCTQGTLWITFEWIRSASTSDDVCVAAGGRYTAPHVGRLFVSNIGSCTHAAFDVEAPRAPAAARSLFDALRTRVGFGSSA